MEVQKTTHSPLHCMHWWHEQHHSPRQAQSCRSKQALGRLLFRKQSRLAEPFLHSLARHDLFLLVVPRPGNRMFAVTLLVLDATLLLETPGFQNRLGGHWQLIGTKA